MSTGTGDGSRAALGGRARLRGGRERRCGGTPGALTGAVYAVTSLIYRGMPGTVWAPYLGRTAAKLFASVQRR